MVLNTSITELEIRIVQFFIEHSTEQFAIREVSRRANTDFKNTHTTVQKLVQKDALIKKRHANVDLCSLNLKKATTPVYYAERLRTESFLEKHKELKSFFQNIQENTKTIFYSLVVFGSFAKGTETKMSDVDLLIVASAKSVGEEIARIVSIEALLLKHKVHLIVLDEKEFVQNVRSKGLNVIVEAFKNHIIIVGIESFYRGICQSDNH